MSNLSNYRKKLVDKILLEIGNTYQIVDKKTDYVYKIEHNGQNYMMRIIDPATSQWSKLESFDEIVDGYQDRVVANYRLFSILKIGPKLYKTYIIHNVPVIISEFLGYEIVRPYTIDTKNRIKEFIQNMHNMGIYHGDLHDDNIMADMNGNIKLIDLETVFYRDELNINNDAGIDEVVNEWITTKFYNISTIDQFIEFEENMQNTI